MMIGWPKMTELRINDPLVLFYEGTYLIVFTEKIILEILFDWFYVIQNLTRNLNM